MIQSVLLHRECIDRREHRQQHDGYQYGAHTAAEAVGVRQDAHLSMDEEGTRAAAVTEIDLPATEVIPFEEPVLMNVNRPFTALIVDQTTDTVVFAAVVADPAGENAD